eukprot:5825417-Alexandrium_andersonii.AAC.1
MHAECVMAGTRASHEGLTAPRNHAPAQPLSKSSRPQLLAPRAHVQAWLRSPNAATDTPSPYMNA